MLETSITEEQKQISKRIQERLDAVGISQESIANEIGTSQTTISRIYRGETRNSKYLDDVARILGVTKQWILFGGDVIQKPQTQESNASYSDLQLAPWNSDTPLDDDEVELPFLKEIQLSAGAGSEIKEDYKGRKLRFSKRALKNRSITPINAVCVTVHGESMEPVYINGSTVGVDKGATKVIDGDIYAVDNGGLLQIKILRRITVNKVQVESYHPSYKPFEKMIGDDFEIIGRVFWYSALF